jgi:hypothetical protein
MRAIREFVAILGGEDILDGPLGYRRIYTLPRIDHGLVLAGRGPSPAPNTIVREIDRLVS